MKTNSTAAQKQGAASVAEMMSHACDEINRLRDQNAELLAALVALIGDLELRAEIHGEDSVVPCSNGVYLEARAAIANAKGKA